jgi:hypothetical protein
MNWFTKALGALARPLGISSPEDTRGRPGLRGNDKAPLQVVADRTPKSEPPKDPASTR